MCEHYVNKFRPHIHFCPNQIIVDGYAMVLVYNSFKHNLYKILFSMSIKYRATFF